MVRLRDIIRANKPCSEKRVLCDDNECDACFNKSFASCIPNTIKIADKNINPRQIQKYSQKELLFECDTCNHEFNKTIIALTTGEHCVYCTTKPVTLCDKENCNFCFEKSFASHEKSKCWDYEKNKLIPRQIYKRSIKKFWFICNICNHSFETSPNIIFNEHFCPYCANLKICGDFRCIECYQKSFATHLFASSWSFKNEALPWEVFKSAHSKYIFDCKNCGHENCLVLYSLDEQALNCIYCSGKKLCNDEKCEPCFNKSFESNSFSKYWSSKNKVQPRDVLNKTHYKYLFNCRVCKHEFQIQLSNIKEDKLNCIYCANLKMCNDENCKICVDKSFASNEKAKYWSENNKVKPNSVFKCSDAKYLFNCNYCKGEFTSSLSQITRGSWCNLCVNKTEKMLKEWLIFNYGNDNVITQYLVKVGNKKYFYDFYLPEFDLLIELDGLQHFEQVGNWKSPEHALFNDTIKINLAINDNKSIIRVLQEDVFYNRNGWTDKLFKCIQKYEKLSCIFIDNNNLYENHINILNNKVTTIII